jgi:hypothetical protein
MTAGTWLSGYLQARRLAGPIPEDDLRHRCFVPPAPVPARVQQRPEDVYPGLSEPGDPEKWPEKSLRTP